MKYFSTIFFFLLLTIAATAQFKENHKYVIGGSLGASTSSDQFSITPRFGKVLPGGNLLGLTGSYFNSNGNTNQWSVSGWYRFINELDIVSFPIFYRTDLEAGYLDNNPNGSIIFSIRPGFTIPLTEVTYLDLSIASVQFLSDLDDGDFDALVSLNNIGVGIVFGL